MSFRSTRSPALDEHLLRELATASRVKSIEMPLSSEARVFIILDGEMTEQAFQRLHEVVKQIKEAYFPSPIVQPVITAVERPPRQPGQRAHPLRPKAPCVKHPESPRNPKSNRCEACEKVKYGKLRTMMLERWEKQKAKDRQQQERDAETAVLK